jgi:hypothetical protein
VRTAEEEKRDRAVIEKIHSLTASASLDWSDGPEGLTARYGSGEVIIRRYRTQPPDIIIKVDAPEETSPLKQRHLVNVRYVTDGRWFKQKLEEIDHMARRQYHRTDDIIDDFLRG